MCHLFTNYKAKTLHFYVNRNTAASQLKRLSLVFV